MDNKAWLSTAKMLLPEFPRTAHLPFRPNMEPDDLIASAAEIEVLKEKLFIVEEKIDGASVGMRLSDGEALIRNREHILRKGYQKDTAAKNQFKSIWNWFYENKKCFEKIGPYSVYGEWCWARHGVHYDRLPAYFIAYDLYDPGSETFVDPVHARPALEQAGFTVPTLYFLGVWREPSLEGLTAAAEGPSAWSSLDPREGAYLKVYDDQKLTPQITHRFKVVSPTYKRGKYWDPSKLSRNSLA